MLNNTNLKFICDYVCVGIKKNSKEQQERLSGFCCTIKISEHNKKMKNFVDRIHNEMQIYINLQGPNGEHRHNSFFVQWWNT